MPPRPGLVINCSQEAIDARESYTVTAGTFVKDNIAIGPEGIAMSGAPGQYKLEDFELGEILGKVSPTLPLPRRAPQPSLMIPGSSLAFFCSRETVGDP